DVGAIFNFFLPISQIEADITTQRGYWGYQSGDAQGGFSDLCQRRLLAHSVPALWGEPARPAFPRRGKLERGSSDFLAAAGSSRWCGCRWQARRWFTVCSVFFHVSLQHDHQTSMSIRSFPLSRNLAGATHSFAVLLSAL